MFNKLVGLLLNSEILPSVNNTFFNVIGNAFVVAGAWLLQGLATIIYSICKFAFGLVDFMQFLVQKLAGIDGWMNLETLNLTDLKETDVVFRFLLSDQVIQVFRTMFTVFLVLLIVFTIVAIVKSEYNLAVTNGDPEKGSHKNILLTAGRAILTVVMVPFVLIIGILASNAILASLAKAFNLTTNLSLSGQIFVASAYDASTYRYYAREGIRKPVSNTVHFSYGGTAYTVNSAMPVVDPDNYGESDPFKGYMFTYDGEDFFLWKCASSEKDAYYHYIKGVLGAVIVESSPEASAAYKAAFATYNTEFRSDDVVEAAEDMYSYLLGNKRTADSVTAKGFASLALDDYQARNLVIKAAYNTWKYNNILTTSISGWKEHGNSLESESYTYTTYAGTSMVAKQYSNSKAWGKLHDGGVNGFVPLAVEYEVMADVVDFVIQNGVTLYYVNASNTNINYQTAGLDSFTRYQETGDFGGFLVDYKEEGKVAYDIKDVNSEVDGAIYIICYFDNQSNQYIPLVNNQNMVDAKGNKYFFTSGQYNGDYSGVVIARGMFKKTTQARQCEPTYITTTMVVDQEGADFDSKVADAVKLDFIGNEYYNYAQKLSNAQHDDVSLTVNTETTFQEDSAYVKPDNKVHYYDKADDVLGAEHLNEISETIVGQISDQFAADGYVVADFANIKNSVANKGVISHDKNQASDLVISFQTYFTRTGETEPLFYVFVNLTFSGKNLAEDSILQAPVPVEDIYQYEFNVSYNVYNTYALYSDNLDMSNRIEDHGKNTFTLQDMSLEEVTTYVYTNAAGKKQIDHVYQYQYSVVGSEYTTYYRFNAMPDNTYAADGGVRLVTATNNSGTITLDELGDSVEAHDEEELLFELKKIRVVYMPTFSYLSEDASTYTFYLIDTLNTTESSVIYYSYNFSKTATTFSFNSTNMKAYQYVGGTSSELGYVAGSEDFTHMQNYIQEHFNVKTYDVFMNKMHEHHVGKYNDSTYYAITYSNHGDVFQFTAEDVYTMDGEESVYDPARFLKNYTTGSINGATYNKAKQSTEIDAAIQKLIESPISVVFCRDEMTTSTFPIDFRFNIWTKSEGLDFIFRVKMGYATGQINDDFSNNVVLTIDKGAFATDYNFYGQVKLGNVYLITEFNWIVLIFAIILIFNILGKAVWGLIKRIYEITLLFLVMPGVASLMPLDPKGSRFGKWKEQMISQVLGAYGVTIGLNFFFIMIPVIRDASAIFTDADVMNMTPALQWFVHDAARLNFITYILFLLVALTLLKTVPGLISQFVGGADMLKQGEDTFKGVTSVAKEAAGAISGKQALQSWENIKTIASPLTTVPGKAIYDKIRDDQKKKADAKKKKKDEERNQQNIAAAGQDADNRQDEANKLMEAANNIGENPPVVPAVVPDEEPVVPVVDEKPNDADDEAEVPTAKKADGLTGDGTDEVVEKVKNELAENKKDEESPQLQEAINKTAENAEKAAQFAAAAKLYAESTDLRAQAASGNVKRDYVAEMEAAETQRKEEEKEARRHARSKVGKAENAVQEAQNKIDEQIKLAAEGKGKKTKLSDDDITEYNKRHKDDAGYVPLLHKGDKGYYGAEQRALRQRAKQEKYMLDKLVPQLHKAEGILSDAKQGIYRGLGGSFVRGLLVGRKTQERRDAENAEFAAAQENNKAAKSDQAKLDNILKGYKSSNLRTPEEARDLLQQLAGTTAGKNVFDIYNKYMKKHAPNGTEEEINANFRAAVDQAVNESRKNAKSTLNKSTKRLKKAEEAVLEDKQGFAHFVGTKLGGAGRVVAAKGAALLGLSGEYRAKKKQEKIANEQQRIANEQQRRENIRNEKIAAEQALDAVNGLKLENKTRAAARELLDDLMKDKNFGGLAKEVFDREFNRLSATTKTTESRTVPAVEAALRAVQTAAQNRVLSANNALNKLEKLEEAERKKLARKAEKREDREFKKSIEGLTKTEKQKATLGRKISKAQAKWDQEAVKNIQSIHLDEAGAEQAMSELYKNKRYKKFAKKAYDKAYEGQSGSHRRYERAVEKTVQEVQAKYSKPLTRAKAKLTKIELEIAKSKQKAAQKQQKAVEKQQKVDEKLAKAARVQSYKKVTNLGVTTQAKISEMTLKRTQGEQQREDFMKHKIDKNINRALAKVRLRAMQGKGYYSDEAHRKEAEELIRKFRSKKGLTPEEEKRLNFYLNLSAANLKNKMQKTTKQGQSMIERKNIIDGKVKQAILNAAKASMQEKKVDKATIDKIVSNVQKQAALDKAALARQLRAEVNKAIKQKQPVALSKGPESKRAMQEIKQLKEVISKLKAQDYGQKRNIKKIQEASRKMSKQLKNQKSKSALSQATNVKNSFGDGASGGDNKNGNNG